MDRKRVGYRERTEQAVRYPQYINSQRWKARRKRWFAANPVTACQACETTGPLQLHHRTYDRLGQEDDTDLVALCEACHRGAHDWQRFSGLTLEEATRRVLEAPKTNSPTPELPKPANAAGSTGGGFPIRYLTPDGRPGRAPAPKPKERSIPMHEFIKRQKQAGKAREAARLEAKQSSTSAVLPSGLERRSHG